MRRRAASRNQACRLGLAAALSAVASVALAAPVGGVGDVHHVRIRRDGFGVPHVLGRTDADAAYGLGFAEAEDDYATVQEIVLAARGRLASLKGPAAEPGDLLFQMLDVPGAIQAGYERDLTPHVRGILEAYAAGVNRYGALHPEKVAPGVLPVTGRDLAAFTLYRGPTFYGLDKVVVQALTGKLPIARDETGSNAVAVGPSRSADGHTRLLFNAHQPFTGPLTFYEAVVQSGEGWHVAGGFFPAMPFLLGGHNDHLGWAATSNNPDLVDVYRLTVNPQNPGQYRLDGQWRDFGSRTVTIEVRQPDGTLKTTPHVLLTAAQGPVVKGPQGVFAIRYPTFGGVRQMQQYYAMNTARSLAEWKAAMAQQALPSINYVYADEKGHIGFLANGLYPVRKEGFDWKGVVPGDRSDLIWTKLRPISQSPQVWDPKSGFVFNSNNTPLHASAPADDPDSAAFPASMGLQTDMTNRAYRALETYGADTRITAEAFERYKYDLNYSAKSDEAAWVAAVTAVDPGQDKDLAAAQSTLRAWDRSSGLHDRGTALIAIMWLQKRYHPDWTPMQTLRATIPLLKAAFGRVDPEWGEVNRLRRGKLDLPVDGAPDVYRAIYGPPDKDGRLHAIDGDGYVMFMDWDRAGRITSRSIHQFGSAAQDETSPHYADQSPLFARHEIKPVLFTEGQLAGHVTQDYSPDDEAPAQGPTIRRAD